MLKKITGLLLFGILINSNIQSQNNQVSLGFGMRNLFDIPRFEFFVPVVNSIETMLPIELSLQHAINDKIVLGVTGSYHLQPFNSIPGLTIIGVEPNFNYYTNKKFNGFHVGSNLAISMWSAKNIQTVKVITMGVGIGYSVPVTKQLLFDVNFKPGYDISIIEGSSKAFVSSKIGVSLGYLF